MAVINRLYILLLMLGLPASYADGVYKCSSSDQGLMGPTFGSDYWNCIQSTSLSYQIENCIRSQYPGVLEAITGPCEDCISNVFLLTGANCIVSCRTQSDSPECNACRSTVASHWRTCVANSIESTSSTLLIVLFAFNVIFML